MKADKLFTDPGTFIQAVVDTHYNEVLNNAYASKLVQGDVGEEALFNAIMQAYESGDTELVAHVLQVNLDINRFSPEYQTQFARVLGQLQPQYSVQGGEVGPPMEDGSFYSNQGGGGGFDWNSLGGILSSAGDLFTNVWGTVQGNGNQPPTGGGTGTGQQGNDRSIDNTTLIIVAVAAVAAIIIAAIILKK